jgi:integrase
MPSSGDSRRVRVERGIYQQPNGKYAVCVRVDGRARFRTVEAATLLEAMRQRELLQSSGRLGDLPLSPRLTFAEIAGRWLADFQAKAAAGQRRDRTLDLYRSQLHRHLLPRLGNRRLALITTDDVVAVARDLQADGLSPWTVKRILGALSCVFTFALRRGYVNSHPFDRLERDERPHPLRSDQRVLTQSELARLFAACPRRYRPLLLTGAFTGMRLSEVLALSWDDVDFAAGVVHVRHQLARGRRGVAPHRIAPKTRASIREIPLLPQLAAVLGQHKRGSCFTRGSDYVFATGNGTAFLHHNVSKRVLRRAATGAGLDRPGRRVRFHDLRHTFASHPIIDIRLDVVQVSRILGHARTSMTLDTYTHLFEAARDGADVRAELAKSDFANLLARTSEPTARRGRAIGRSAGAATRGRVRVPACRPGRARTPSRSASPAPRPAAAASAPTYCAGHSRSARSPNDSCPSARPAAPG